MSEEIPLGVRPEGAWTAIRRGRAKLPTHVSVAGAPARESGLLAGFLARGGTIGAAPRAVHGTGDRMVARGVQERSQALRDGAVVGELLHAVEAPWVRGQEGS